MTVGGGGCTAGFQSSLCRRWVKNGPDALEMGCLHYPRKQTSVGYAADCDVIAHAAGVVAARDQRGDVAGGAPRVDADPAVRGRAGRSRAPSQPPTAAGARRVGWALAKPITRPDCPDGLRVRLLSL